MSIESQNNAIAYEGHCAFAVSTGKTDVKGGKNSLTIDGKTYFFSNPLAKFLFKLLPNRVEKADTHWKNK
jgi:YHS domain-containing protein